MKDRQFARVEFCNRKKHLKFEFKSKKKLEIHYGQLGIEQNILGAWVDCETTNSESVGIEFEDGTVEYIPYDQPLILAKDPDFLLQIQIEQVVAGIVRTLEQKSISKSFVARQLGTSENQVHRLLNPAILNKNLKQLFKIASILELELEISLRYVA